MTPPVRKTPFKQLTLGIAALAMVMLALGPASPALASELTKTPGLRVTTNPAEHGLTWDYVNRHDLELRDDGFYYAPGDSSPTVDIPMETAPVIIIDKNEDQAQPLISKVACNGRIDYYRLITTSNTAHCFANSGFTSSWPHINSVKGQCPGANKGRFNYYHSGAREWRWSAWRGPTSNHRTCYWFANNENFAVGHVQIG